MIASLLIGCCVSMPDGEHAERRADTLAAMQKVMGALPGDAKKVPLDVRVIEETDEGKFVKRRISIAVEKGDRLPAFLLIPKGVVGKVPGVVCLHPTHRELGSRTVVGEHPKPDRHYAKELAERGFVVIAPDYVNMGAYRFNPYQNGYASATMKGIWNHMRCVDLLRSMPEVNAGRIGAIGHSLGGHNSIFLAAFDDRVKCVVSSCGFCSFPRYYGGDLTGWSHDGYMPRIKTEYGLDPKKMPFDFPEVIVALAPRAFLAVAPGRDSNFDAEGVRDCIRSATPVYESLGAGDNLKAIYPDAGHDFPDAARETAYRWLERHLKD